MSKKKIGNSEERPSHVDLFVRAIEALRCGEVIVFPTETFYGLGANITDQAAVEKVVALKGRNPDSPIPVIVTDEEMLGGIVTEIPPLAKKLIRRFWPGPLTLVLTAKEGFPTPVLNRNGGIGVRVSSHPIAARLVRELGCPLTATSANRSGEEPARTVDEAMAYFSGAIKHFLDAGRLQGRKGSTVLEISRNKWRIIREGEIQSQQLVPILEG